MWTTIKSIVLTVALSAIVIATLWLSYLLVPIGLVVLIFLAIRSYFEYQNTNQ